MAAVQQKLEAARLPKESVRTLAYSLEEEFDYANNRRTSRGFRAVNTIEVRLDDIGSCRRDPGPGGWRRRHERSQHPLRPEGSGGGRTPRAAPCRCRRARARRGRRGRRARDRGDRHAHRRTGTGNAGASSHGDDARERRRRRCCGYPGGRRRNRDRRDGGADGDDQVTQRSLTPAGYRRAERYLAGTGPCAPRAHRGLRSLRPRPIPARGSVHGAGVGDRHGSSSPRRPRRQFTAGCSRCCPAEGLRRPVAILAVPEARPRAAGLSRAKAAYIRDLAARVRANDVHLDALAILDDEARRRRIHESKGDRPMVGRDVPHVPAASARCTPGRGPRHRQCHAAGVWAAKGARGHSDAEDCCALASVPVGGVLVPVAQP